MGRQVAGQDRVLAGSRQLLTAVLAAGLHLVARLQLHQASPGLGGLRRRRSVEVQVHQPLVTDALLRDLRGEARPEVRSEALGAEQGRQPRGRAHGLLGVRLGQHVTPLGDARRRGVAPAEPSQGRRGPRPRALRDPVGVRRVREADLLGTDADQEPRQVARVPLALLDARLEQLARGGRQLGVLRAQGVEQDLQGLITHGEQDRPGATAPVVVVRAQVEDGALQQGLPGLVAVPAHEHGQGLGGR